MKKFLTIMACFAFAVFGFLGFVGCADNTNSITEETMTAEETTAFFDNVTMSESMEQGYKYSTNAGGTSQTIYVHFSWSKPEFLHYAAYTDGNMKTYFNGNMIYLESGDTKVKKEFTLAQDPTDDDGNMEEAKQNAKYYLTTSVEKATFFGDLREGISALIEFSAKKQTNSKTGETIIIVNGKVEYPLFEEPQLCDMEVRLTCVNGAVEKFEMTRSATLAYQTRTEKMTVEAYTGAIPAPTDLDEYV